MQSHAQQLAVHLPAHAVQGLEQVGRYLLQEVLAVLPHGQRVHECLGLGGIGQVHEGQDIGHGRGRYL